MLYHKGFYVVCMCWIVQHLFWHFNYMYIYTFTSQGFRFVTFILNTGNFEERVDRTPLFYTYELYSDRRIDDPIFLSHYLWLIFRTKWLSDRPINYVQIHYTPRIGFYPKSPLNGSQTKNKYKESSGISSPQLHRSVCHNFIRSVCLTDFKGIHNMGLSLMNTCMTQTVQI